MEMIFVTRDSCEWLYMWLWLELHEINAGLAEPMVAENNGEVWQYMCSYQQNDKTVHEFRHRSHPSTNGPKTLSLHASATFSNEQIEKKVKIN